jgi:imidazolonepropionase-like amidohydrolase
VLTLDQLGISAAGIKIAVDYGVDSVEHGTEISEETLRTMGEPWHLPGAHQFHRTSATACWRRARISAISSKRGAKNERARVSRKGKRDVNEKQHHEIRVRKVGE